jgi:hypothetical protein
MGAGLAAFAGGQFIGALANAASSIMGFLTGSDSPIEEMVKVADKADDLTRGANALDRIGAALQKISGLRFDGSSLNVKEFADDLMESIPAIEAAIMGGTIGGNFITSGTQIKGLASPDIDFDTATARLAGLRTAMGLSGPDIDTRSQAVNQSALLGSGGDQALDASTNIVTNSSTSVRPTTVVSVSPQSRVSRWETSGQIPVGF